MADQKYEPQNAIRTGHPQIDAIMGLLGEVSQKFEPEAPQSWAWMARRATDPAVADLLMRELTFTSLRVLDAIGQSEPINGISISKQSGVPKGTVSKTTRRLMGHKLIQSETLPDNRKEIRFRLTPLGRQVFEIHRAFDAAMLGDFARFLKRYNGEELDFLVRLLTELLGEEFLAEG